MISFDDNHKEFVDEVGHEVVKMLRPYLMPLMITLALFVLMVCIAFMYQYDRMDQLQERLLNVENNVYS